MFISKFKHWLDDVDPYAIQRIALYKALFIATIVVYVYWLFLPVNFMAFILPFFLVSLYEQPGMDSMRKKERLLLFISASIVAVSFSFYLMYPFRLFFLFFSFFMFSTIYYLVLKYFYSLKNMVMLILAVGSIVLNIAPSGNLQTAYGIVTSIALSITTVLICLRIFPNQYLIVWNKALQKFIEYFEDDISKSLRQETNKPIVDEIIHFQMVRSFQPLVGKKYMLQTYRVAVYIRNIQISLDNLYYEEKNELFWCSVRQYLHDLRMNMSTYTPYDVSSLNLPCQTKLHYYVLKCLSRAFIHWNKLCKIWHS